MAVTVLSGTSGALYYKPAGTTGTFGTTGVNTGTDTITIQQYLNLKAGDPVQFSVVNSQTGGAGSGTLPAGIVRCYHLLCADLHRVHWCADRIGNAWRLLLDITDDGTAVAPNEFQVAYAEYAAVGPGAVMEL
jgi:hypothetical protein